MKKLPQAITLLREVFETYAGKDGDSTTLSKKEMSRLLHKELDVDPSEKKEVDKCFKELDDDGDGVLNFEEYVTFVVMIMLLCDE